MRALYFAAFLGCTLIAVAQGPSSSPASAQELTGITATVRNAAGDHIPGAEVVLNPAENLSEDWSLRRDASMGAAFTVRAAAYVIQARFNPKLRKSVAINLSQGEVQRVLFVMVDDRTEHCRPSPIQAMPEFFGRSDSKTNNGSIWLTVYDASGAVLPGARVDIFRTAPNHSDATIARLTADALGSTKLEVEPGTYVLAILQRGFRELRFEFTVGGAQTWGIAAVLSVMPTCDGVKVTVPERSITPPSPNDHIDPKHP